MSNSDHKVIELSIEETDRLRVSLGLKPLRVTISQEHRPVATKGQHEHHHDKEVSRVVKGKEEGGSGSGSGAEVVLTELSIEETDTLRRKLGLRPLRRGGDVDDDVRGVRRDADEKKSALENTTRNLREEVERGMERFRRDNNDGNAVDVDGEEGHQEDSTTKAWAASMLTQKQSPSKKERKKNKSSKKMKRQADMSYNERDLEGMKVSHSVGELEDGTTTVLTLADTSIVQQQQRQELKEQGGSGEDEDEEHDDDVLENANLRERSKMEKGLLEKRKMEMGAGRAGGYAGYDDDEFVELGGTQAPSRSARRTASTTGGTGQDDEDAVDGKGKKKRKRKTKKEQRGFHIGKMFDELDRDAQETDLFAFQQGKAISLHRQQSSTAALSGDGQLFGLGTGSSDFMTTEEMEEEEQRKSLQRKSLEQGKFKKAKKDKKRKKDDKKTRRRRREDQQDDEDRFHDDGRQQGEFSKQKPTLLEELEATADGDSGVTSSRRRRKRSRDDDHDPDQDHPDHRDGQTLSRTDSANPGAESAVDDADPEASSRLRRLAKYDAIVAKGNERTRLAFQSSLLTNPADSSGVGRHDQDEEKDDDAFLNAAVAKACRLNRLKQMMMDNSNQRGKIEDAKDTEGLASSNGENEDGADRGVDGRAIRGAAARAVVAAVEATKRRQNQNDAVGIAEGKTVMFTVDETREFARALRARNEQDERRRRLKQKQQQHQLDKTTTTSGEREEPITSGSGRENDDSGDGSGMVHTEEAKRHPTTEIAELDAEDDEDVNLSELAKEMKDHETDMTHDSSAMNERVTVDDGGLDGTTATTVPVGRGLGNVLSMLRRTGEMTRKNAGMEEMHGRAKDKRTYEDYEQMDLSKVVNIDSKSATQKDRELAKREVKLEYRDSYGRLLTRKEAFRDLSYQFHGKGSGKKKQEKRLKQIAMERAQGRLASNQTHDGAGAGVLGAVKATQKATGKAFIVHKAA